VAELAGFIGIEETTTHWDTPSVNKGRPFVKQRPTTVFLFRGVLCMYRVISEDRVLLSNLKQATIGWLHTKKPTEKLA
jgi:hypothetical protein